MSLPADSVVAALVRSWEAYAVSYGATPYEAAALVGNVRARFAGVALTDGIVDQVLHRIRTAAEGYRFARAMAAGAAAAAGGADL